MSMLEDIAKYLEDNGLGTQTEDIFLWSEPEKPDTCVTLYEYAGSPPDLQAEMEFPGLQVRARNASGRTARAKLQAIQELLQEIGNEYNVALAEGVTINGTQYAAVRAVQGISSLGENDNGLLRLVQNYNVSIIGG